MNQLVKKGFRKPMEFIEAADNRPDSVVINPKGEGVDLAKPEGEGSTPPADAVAVPPPAETVAKPKKPKDAKPWAEANAKVKVSFLTRLPEALHMKLAYLSKHVPNASIHSLILEAAEEKVAKLLKDLEKQ